MHTKSIDRVSAVDDHSDDNQQNCALDGRQTTLVTHTHEHCRPGRFRGKRPRALARPYRRNGFALDRADHEKTDRPIRGRKVRAADARDAGGAAFARGDARQRHSPQRHPRGALDTASYGAVVGSAKNLAEPDAARDSFAIGIGEADVSSSLCEDACSASAGPRQLSARGQIRRCVCPGRACRVPTRAGLQRRTIAAAVALCGRSRSFSRPRAGS